MRSLGLRLDHASLQVPHLEGALEVLTTLGLKTTRTAGVTHHARVHFDRAYLEVSAPPNRPVPGARIPLYFLGAPNVLSLLPELKSRGVTPQQVGLFRGVDGVWDDVVLGGTNPKVPPPILVSRKEPAELVGHWPPPLRTPHPNAAQRLASVFVATPALDETAAFLGLLGGEAEGETELPAFAAIRRRVHFEAGRIDLLKAARPGRVADWLSSRGPGAMGMSLAVRSMGDIAERLTSAGFDAYAGDGEIFTDAPFGPDALFAFEPA